MPLKFSNLVELVSKKPIPPHVKQLVTEVMVSDEDGEDVEVRVFFYLTSMRADEEILRSHSLLFVFEYRVILLFTLSCH